MNEEIKFPFEIKDVEPEQNERLLKYFKAQYSGFVQVGPKGYFLPQKYRREAAKIYNMPIRPSDVFVTSYPRSGTTWTQELVWMVVNDLDYETSNNIPLTDRFPFLEFYVLIHPTSEAKFREENSYSEEKSQLIDLVCQSRVEILAKTASPRFIKSHLPLSLLPPTILDTAKMIYVARNPRDVAVSFYHLNRLNRVTGYIGDFKTYWNFFIQNMQHWTPFFEHLKEAWAKRHDPNMLFLFYEELSKDLKASVQRVVKFFDKDFSEEQIDRLCDHLSFDNFKNIKSLNYNALKDLGLFNAGEQTFVRKECLVGLRPPAVGWPASQSNLSGSPWHDQGIHCVCMYYCGGVWFPLLWGKTNGWHDYFDDEMTQQAEQWIADNLRDTDLRFPHLKN